MQETRVRSQGWEDTLEKRMATHSSILAWRIPPTGEAGGLQSMGSQRLEHNWVTHTHTHTHTHTIPLKNIPEELPLTLILEHVQWKIIHSFSSPDNVFISSSLLKGYFSMNIQFFQHLKKKKRKKGLLLGSSIVSEENSVVIWIIVCCLPLAAFKIVLFQQVHYMFYNILKF